MYQLFIIGFSVHLNAIKVGSFIAEKRAGLRRYWSKSRIQNYSVIFLHVMDDCRGLILRVFLNRDWSKTPEKRIYC